MQRYEKNLIFKAFTLRLVLQNLLKLRFNLPSIHNGDYKLNGHANIARRPYRIAHLT